MNPDNFKGMLKVSPLKANLELEVTHIHTMSPYCVVKMGKSSDQQKKGAVARKEGKDPQWLQVHFNLGVADLQDCLEVYVYHKRNIRKDTLIGSCNIPIEKYVNSLNNFTEDFVLYNKQKNRVAGKILLEIYYEPGFTQVTRDTINQKEYELDIDQLTNPFEDDPPQQQQQQPSAYQYQQAMNYTTSHTQPTTYTQPQTTGQITYTNYQPMQHSVAQTKSNQQIIKMTQSVDEIYQAQQYPYQQQSAYQQPTSNIQYSTYQSPQTNYNTYQTNNNAIVTTQSIYQPTSTNQYQTQQVQHQTISNNQGPIVVTQSVYQQPQYQQQPSTQQYQYISPQPQYQTSGNNYQIYQSSQTQQQGGRTEIIDGKLYYIQ